MRGTKVLGIVVLAVISTLVHTVAAGAQVQFTMQNGRVSLVAKDATLKQILAEWARVGQTKIVNVERVPDSPLTLQLIDVPEEQALDTLLRNLSGYVAAPRAAGATGASRFDPCHGPQNAGRCRGANRCPAGRIHHRRTHLRASPAAAGTRQRRAQRQRIVV